MPVIHRLTLLLLAAVMVSAGEGIGIGPALVLIDEVRPGVVIDLGARGLRYSAQNQGAVEKILALTVVSPATYSLKAFEAGYEPLPDPSWLTLEHNTLRVPAASTGTTGVTLRIPDVPEYWNRHYIVYVEVGSGEKVGLGATLRVRSRLLIETAVRDDDAAPAASLIAVTPGRVAMAAGAAGAWQGQATVRNQGPTATFDVLTLSELYPGAQVDRHPRYFPGHVVALADDAKVVVDVREFSLATGEQQVLKVSTAAAVAPKDKPIDAVRFIARRALSDGDDVRVANGRRYDRIELLRLRFAPTVMGATTAR